MALALCVISFALGLVAIDMFCDHYLLVGSSLTAIQRNTCVSYYQNAFHQPWYTSLVTVVPMLLGAFAMVRNIKRTIYDTLSIPLFIGVLGVFLLKIKKDIQALAVENQASNGAKEGYLRQIAYSHAIIAVLMGLLLVLQILAERQAKIPAKKKL